MSVDHAGQAETAVLLRVLSARMSGLTPSSRARLWATPCRSWTSITGRPDHGTTGGLRSPVVPMGAGKS